MTTCDDNETSTGVDTVCTVQVMLFSKVSGSIEQKPCSLKMERSEDL